MSTERPKITLERSALRELTFFAKNVEKLGKIVKASSEEAIGKSTKSIADAISQKVGMPSQDVERILIALVG